MANHSLNFIPLTRPSIPEESISLVNEVIRSGMLVQGKYTQLLEQKFKDYFSGIETCMLSNGTATLHTALLALGIKPGDEIIVPAFSYVATANVVELVGATSVFVDVDEDTFNIDVHKIEEKITSKTKAIIPVHEFGLACDIEAIMEIAKKHKLYVIEDAACALGAAQNGKLVGTFGDVGSFSFHPRKNITSGEGGLIVTKNHQLAKTIKTLRNHGIDPENAKMDFIAAGYNYRMTDFQSALLLPQVDLIKNIILKKEIISNYYLENIKNSKIKLPIIPKNRNHTWQTFHVVLDERMDRNKAIEDLKDAGIGTNYGAQCIPSMTYYQKKYQLNSAKLFPNAYKNYNFGLALPIYDSLTQEELAHVVSVLNTL